MHLEAVLEQAPALVQVMVVLVAVVGVMAVRYTQPRPCGLPTYRTALVVRRCTLSNYGAATIYTRL